MFYGLCNLSWWGYLLVVLGLTQITIMGVTIYLHRCQAHRALILHPVISHFFRFWLWLATGMVTKEWAAVHRKHHAKCETPEDPHSPQVAGLPLVFWYGAELYRKEAADDETLMRYGAGTPDDWIETNLYTKHSKLGIILMFAIDLILFGIPGLAVWALQMVWIPLFAAGVVNGIGHYWGYRNFECPDQSRNISPWGVFIGGEELHNNHHTYPTSAKFSVKPWEIDFGWFIIQLFEKMGLARAKRVPPLPHSLPGRAQIDMETLKELFTNRFQIMARYSKEVITPIFYQEKRRLQASAGWKRAKNLLIRESSLLDGNAKERLMEFLSSNPTLQVVYQFKERLQNLWVQSQLKEKEILEALQKWCQEAEATGISYLNEFAAYVKSLGLRSA